jgi:hypothetical protein
MADIFLSRSAEYRDRARPVLAAVEKTGWSVHVQHGPTEDRPQRTRTELNAVRCMMLLLSGNTPKSEWVKWEVNAYRSLRHPILTLQLESAREVPFWGLTQHRFSLANGAVTLARSLGQRSIAC